ncbi:hypothetical protein GR7B_00025 [Vibrio phage vB_VcorM_GR7B]|nr:hypothetical protein GR7B_00025 [Vibrio phage vB_VcorM_GR7B]
MSGTNDTLATHFEVVAKRVLASYVGKLNTEETREAFIQDMSKELGFPYEYIVTVICDKTNNPPSLVDEGNMCVSGAWVHETNKDDCGMKDVYIKPEKGNG